MFKLKNCLAVSPKKHSGELCNDILQDPKAVHEIKTWAEDSEELSIVPYSSTPQFYKMISALKKQKINITCKVLSAVHYSPPINAIELKKYVIN